MKWFLFAAACAALAAPVSAASVDPVVAAERAFAKAAQDTSVNAAFRTYIADDGVLFVPEPVPGKKLLASTPERPGTLKWWPVYAGMAASGDLGFTTGPYVMSDGRQEGYGHYFTVWKKQPDGSWRWLLDHGTRTTEASPLGRDTPVTALAPAPAVAKAAAGGAWGEVTAAEAKLAAALATDAKTALSGVLVDDGRVMRNGPQPAIGRAAFTAALAEGPATIRVAPLGGQASSAGDLAFSYGTADWQSGGKDRHGHYVRIWQRRADGWRVIVDELIPAPPAPPKPAS